ncbi:FimV family protein [Hydrogenophaga sp.]|uniref:type IV pilus assembly protein FimV n=1 Tax=Hydrogenophaga sp. TaxID=1904254 RepID=UPI002720D047|nr:hypothetical protein [Hydrogenophaga sp.]MDO8906697.1 hypothetical protein [Hydrogenophaga sp.]
MRQFWLGCILLSTVLSSAAASLGRQSGAAVIGRPLDVRIQVLLAPGEELNALCLSADVRYGDTLLPSTVVSLIPQRTAPDAEASIRVQAARVIDEPIVMVDLRAGCNASHARQYVFLADLVTETQSARQPAAPPLPVAVAPLPTAGASQAAPAVASPDASAAAGGTQASRPRTTPPVASAVRAPAQASTPPSVVRRPAAPQPPASAPRLQLEPVDLSLNIERDPTLRLSMTMLSEPTDSEEVRASAARLWAAINASPDDILRDAQKLAVLEAEAQGLRSEEARNQATIAQMKSSLDRSRYMSWLVYLLAALLLMALLALIVVWRRKGEAQDGEASKAWWSEDSKAELAQKTKEPSVPAKGGDVDLDLDFDLGEDSGFGGPRQGDALASRLSSRESDSIPSIPSRDKRDFSASAIGGGRSVATEELFDVQQQADFFVSLGEDEQAIQVLVNHLADSHEPSPLAYLDLFKLYHRLDRRDDYDRLRTEFNEVFNAGAPPFEHYSDQSRGLESYETAFTRIQALWGDARVLDVIEQSIFREAGDGEGEVFDLEAYRELLLLHTIAKDIVKREAAPDALTNFQHTKVQPLKAAGVAGTSVAATTIAAADAAEPMERHTEPMESMPPASPRLGLDLDLTELDAYSEFEASLPEVAAPVEPTSKPVKPGESSTQGPASNLIDFEVLDFVPPSEDDAPSDRGNSGKN